MISVPKVPVTTVRAKEKPEIKPLKNILKKLLKGSSLSWDWKVYNKSKRGSHWTKKWICTNLFLANNCESQICEKGAKMVNATFA